MGSSARQQIRGAREGGNASASTSKDRRDTERISIGAIQRTKKGLLTKPNRTLQADDPGAVPKHNEAAVNEEQRPVPHQPIIVRELEGAPHYEQPEGSTSVPEQRQPRARSPRDHPSRLAQRPSPDAEEPGPAPTDAANHRAATPQEPSNVPDIGLDGVHRPCVAKLQESLFALDDICKGDGQVRVQVEEIGRLIAVIRRKESEIAQKVRDVQRTRVTVERLYTSQVKRVPALIGLGTEEVQDTTEPEPEPEDETRTSPPMRKKRPAEEQPDDPPQEAEESRPSLKRVRA